MALGLCKQLDLDAAVIKAAAKKAKAKEPVPSAEERISLMSTAESLMTPGEPHAPHRLSAFENFGLDDRRGAGKAAAKIDPDSLVNLPKSGKEDDEEDEGETP